MDGSIKGNEMFAPPVAVKSKIAITHIAEHGLSHNRRDDWGRNSLAAGPVDRCVSQERVPKGS
jgi:hypothetical protein